MRGFSTIEILIALMFLSSMLVAASLLVLGAPLVVQSAREHHEARALAETALLQEEARSPEHFEEIVDYSLRSGNYTVELLSALLPDESTKRLTAHVSWTSASGKERAFKLVSYLTDYLHPSSYPCDILPRGNWSQLESSEYLRIPGEASDIATTRTILAVSSESTATANTPSLFLYSLAEGEPAFLGAIPTSSTTAAVSDLVLTDTHAYLASASTCTTISRCGQLKTVDLSVPRIESQLLLSRTSPPYAGTASTPVAAKSIAYRDRYAYIGLEQTPTSQGQEFNIIDVRNPDTPRWIAGYRVGRTVNDIILAGDRAYLATNARGLADVLILDIRDPFDIHEIGRIALPPYQTTSTFGYAHTLTLYESELHIGRSYISNADEWVVVDVNDPSFPVRASRNRGTAVTPASIRAILARESQAVVVTSKGVEVWARYASFDPILMTTQAISGEVTDAVCIGNEIYVASDSAQGGVITRVRPL